MMAIFRRTSLGYWQQLTTIPLLATIEPSEKSDGVRSLKPGLQGNDSYQKRCGIHYPFYFTHKAACLEKRRPCMIHFCPHCWHEFIGENVCPSCGNDLRQYLLLTAEDMLILALKHPNQEQRIASIRQLGERKAMQALPAFKQILDGYPGYYVTKEIIYALGAIGSLESLEMISEFLGNDPSQPITRIVQDMKVARQLGEKRRQHYDRDHRCNGA
jgi:hypothetical protein